MMAKSLPSFRKTILSNFYVQVGLFFTLLALTASIFFIFIQGGFLSNIVLNEYIEHNQAVAELIATESKERLSAKDDYALFLDLAKFAQMPDLLGIELYSPEGRLIKGIKNSLNGRQIISSGSQRELPAELKPLVSGNVLSVWQPIFQEEQLIGLVKLRADISSVDKFRLQLTKRSSFVTIFGLLASLLAIALFFYRPLSSLEKASLFALNFIKQPGQVISLPPLPLQFERLKTSLNQASLQLERLEREKAASAASLKVVLDHSVDAILMLDENLKIQFFNPAAESIFGYSAAEISGQSAQILTPIPLTLEMHQENLRNALLKGRRKNGESFYMEVSDNETELAGQRIFIVFIRDVTKAILERRSHKAIEETNRKLAVIANKSSHAVAIVDPEGRHEWINNSFTRLTGYLLEEIKGKTAAEFLFSPLAAEKPAKNRIQEASFIQEQILYTKNQEAIQVLTEGQPVFNDKGDCINYILLLFDVTKERKTEANLLKAKQLAEEASEAKSQFLSRVSHEFRTPLNAILGFSQLLDMTQLSDMQKQHLGHISQAGKHLLNLVNDVLDIAQIEAGKLSLSIETLYLNDVLNESLQLTRHLADDKEITTLIKGNSNLYVKADQQRLKQILINLLSNAYKYNKQQGSVSIFIGHDQNRLELVIEDTGIGIDESKLQELFIPFNRLGAEQSSIEGTGIGLSLSRELVRLLSGRLELSSVRGQGTRVTLCLPIATQSARSDEQANPQLAPLKEQKTVIYIEDNLINLKLIEHALEHLPNLNLSSSMRGDSGLELIKKQLPDIVLLDLHLPGMSGKAVLQALKNDPKTAHIPVIILSADASSKSKEMLRELGASDYLSKPINLTEFIQTMHKYGKAAVLVN